MDMPLYLSGEMSLFYEVAVWSTRNRAVDIGPRVKQFTEIFSTNTTTQCAEYM